MSKVPKSGGAHPLREGAEPICLTPSSRPYAKDEKARGFYERFDFELSPTDPLRLFLLTKDLRASIAG
ncbi:MAG TPA: hypothetical protein VJ224_05975 [Thermoplasmata archaeon]|nr:hypothetical protein [Thermoplasmata archaeon]